jgi:tRNA (cytidine/uridine-2'-O-)-methyltransferase
MFDVLLYQPEIPPNTGNIIRLCANTGARLHLIRPLGFTLEDAQMRRAGLDYHEYASLLVHDDLQAALAALADTHARTIVDSDDGGMQRPAPPRLFALSTRNSTRFDRVAFAPGDAFLFGPETRGLPDEVLATIANDRRLRLPMQPGNRSLNLSNAVAVVIFEAWRQQGFAGGG